MHAHIQSPREISRCCDTSSPRHSIQPRSLLDSESKVKQAICKHESSMTSFLLVFIYCFRVYLTSVFLLRLDASLVHQLVFSIHLSLHVSKVRSEPLQLLPRLLQKKPNTHTHAIRAPRLPSLHTRGLLAVRHWPLN